MDEKYNEEEIEVVIGDDSNLNISDVGDCMNNLRPKTNKEKKKVVIPIAKKKIQLEKKDDDNLEDNK